MPFWAFATSGNAHRTKNQTNKNWIFEIKHEKMQEFAMNIFLENDYVDRMLKRLLSRPI